MKNKTRVCSIDGCNKPHMARGLCMMHWKRLQRHGDPLCVLTKRGMQPEEIFQENIEHTSNGCMLWRGSVGTDGYGYLSVKGKTIGAHREAYRRFRGPIPKGLLVCHSCDTPLCVNPNHLFLGTHKDNTDDMLSKRRHRHGIGVGTAKLSDETVRAIRTDSRGPSELARVMGVSKATISKIKNGKAWTHVS